MAGAAVAPADAGHSGGEAPARTADAYKTVVWQLRLLWPLLILQGIGGGVLAPSITYVGLDFCARRHTDLNPDRIHCESTPDAPYCRDAVLDNTALATILSSVSCVIQFFLGPAIGVVSDSLGRWRVLIFCQTLAMIPMIGFGLYIYRGFGFYTTLALTVFSDLPKNAVALAYCSDLLTEPKNRITAFGLLLATAEASVLIGLSISVSLSLQTCVGVSLTTTALGFLYMLLCIPESLPPERRRPLQWALAAPGAGLQILVRNDLFVRLSFCIVCSSFVGAGVSRVAPSFLQKYTYWTKGASAISLLISQASSILWLAFGLPGITHSCGAVGALLVSMVAGLLMCLCFAFVSQVWQVWFLFLLFSGPMALSFPAVSALTSQAAQEHEQGQIQGALTAAKSMAEGAAPLLFGTLFMLSNMKPIRTRTSGIAFLAATLLLLPAVVVASTLPSRLRRHCAGKSLSDRLLSARSLGGGPSVKEGSAGA